MEMEKDGKIENKQNKNEHIIINIKEDNNNIKIYILTNIKGY